MSTISGNGAQKPQHVVIGIATIAMSALAGGALWCLISLWSLHQLELLILPIGIVLGLIARAQAFRSTALTTICAAVATALTAAYVQYLFAAVHVAQTLGFSLRDTLFKMGPALAWDVIQANAHFSAIAIIVGGMLLAVFFSLRQR